MSVPKPIELAAILLLAGLAGCGRGHQAAQGAAAGPAAAAAAAPDSQNPLFGSWTLVSATDDAYCPDSVQFSADTFTTVSKGVTQNFAPIYHVYPTYVDVAANGDLAHYQQFNLTSPDIITNVTGNEYAINNCPYKRS